jgi:hypothetical protein
LGLLRKNGKDWQFCEGGCPPRNDGLPALKEVHANLDFTRYKVPRGTGKVEVESSDEPLF